MSTDAIDNKNTGLVAPIKDGKINYTGSTESTSKEQKKGTSELGKDAFLQLLVTQMQYQDPLDPSDNTEYISQLATFSQLEQLQNLNTEYTKSQAFSLVGKHVVFQVTDSNGKTTYPEGTVDYVNVSANKVTLTVDGATYDYEQLLRIENDTYYNEKLNPTIDEEVNFSFNADNPDNLYFKVNLGDKEQKATDVAVVFGNAVVDPQFVSIEDSVVTVSKEALAQLPNGEYKPTVIFNNSNMTEVADKITVNVYNSKVGEETSQPSGEEPQN